MKQKKKSRLLSLILSFAMIVCLFSGLTVTANAEDLTITANADPEIYTAYDIKVSEETNTITLKYDVDDRYYRCGIQFCSGSSATEMSPEINFSTNGAFLEIVGDLNDSTQPVNISSDGLTKTFTVYPQNVKDIVAKYLTLDEENPYVWMIIAPCDDCVMLEDGALCTAVCLGRYDSLENFQNLNHEEDEETAASATITYEAGLREISGIVTLNGNTMAGQQLVADFYSHDDTADNSYTVKYEWYRVKDGSETKLENSGSTYTIADEDEGSQIKVVVKVDDGNGYWKDCSTDITAVSAVVETNYSVDYTMTIPANTTVTKADFTALENGLNVSGKNFNVKKQVTVTAQSANGWKLTASGVSTTIGYELYESDQAASASTTFQFSADDINNSITKAIGVKANKSEMNLAKAGTYTDTITFTADLTDAG